MSDLLSTTAKKRQNLDSTFKVSPFQARGFGVQQTAAESAPLSKAQLWENYEQAKQLNQNGANISNPTTLPIQTKLSIGPPGDKYEQEADNNAQQVMAMPEPKLAKSTVTSSVQTRSSSQPIQRACTDCQEETKEESKSEEDSDRIQAKEEYGQTPELTSIQRKVNSAENPESNSNLEDRLNGSKGGGSHLSDEVRGFMEPRFGADFSGVRVHTGSDAVQMNSQLNAQAFAHGSDIYFGAGKSPGTNELTAHELTHVVQQTGQVQSQAAPGASAPANSSTIFTQNNITREVHGATLSQVYDSMTNSGTREAASVLPALKPAPQYQPGFAGEKVKQVVVTVVETKEMPSWAELGQQCPPIKNEWNRFYSALDKHEDKHVEIDRKHYTDVHKKMVGKPKEIAWAKLDAVTEAANLENEAHDLSTRHGRRDGTDINGAVQCGIEKVSTEPGDSGATSDTAVPESTEPTMMAKRRGLTDLIQPDRPIILPKIGLTSLSKESPYLIQRDPTPAPASGVTPPSPPVPSSPTTAPPPNTTTDDGLVYITIPYLPLHSGFHKTLSPVQVDAQKTLAKIPIPEFGITLDLDLALGFGVNWEATLNPVVMRNVTIGMTKSTAAVVGTSIALLPIVGSAPLIAALGLGYFRGYGNLEASGKVGASAYFSVEMIGGAYAGGLKHLDLATTKIGLKGSVSAELLGNIAQSTSIVLDNGHLTFKQGKKLEITPALNASLSGFIETSLLFGLIKGRLSKTWGFQNKWPYKWQPEGSLDLDYDNLGFKDNNKVFVLDIDKIKSIASKTGEVVDFLEKLMKDGEKPAEVQNEEEASDKLPDRRTVDEKGQSLAKALEQSEALLSTPDISPEDVIAQLPTIKRTYRLKVLKLVSISIDNDEYWIEAEVNPKDHTNKHKLVRPGGTQDNPFKLIWPKPPSQQYPSLYFGGQTNTFRSQSTLKGLHTKGLNSGGEPVREFTPHGGGLLPGGERIGITSEYRITKGTIIGPLSNSGTPGGDTLNRILAKYGFSPDAEGLDADHIWEIQFGGDDVVANMWPLDASINRGAGSKLSQAEVEYPDSGKKVSISALKQNKSRRYYFIISGFS